MSERGATSLVAIAGAIVLCLFALLAADLGSVLVSRARAQAAADAAALAAVVRQAPVLAQGDDPEAAARETADRNGATLVVCRCVVGETIAEVEVTVAVSVALVSAWGAKPVRATARAQLDADVLSYRDDG